MSAPEFDPGTQERVDGSPATVEGLGFTIKFQLGPVRTAPGGENGTTIERILEVLRARLEGFQRGPFRCRANAEAMAAIEDADTWLRWRTAARTGDGVEGQNAAHHKKNRALPGGVRPRCAPDGARLPIELEAEDATAFAPIGRGHPLVLAVAAILESPAFATKAGKDKLSPEEKALALMYESVVGEGPGPAPGEPAA